MDSDSADSPPGSWSRGRLTSHPSRGAGSEGFSHDAGLVASVSPRTQTEEEEGAVLRAAGGRS